MRVAVQRLEPSGMPRESRERAGDRRGRPGCSRRDPRHLPERRAPAEVEPRAGGRSLAGARAGPHGEAARNVTCSFSVYGQEAGSGLVRASRDHARPGRAPGRFRRRDRPGRGAGSGAATSTSRTLARNARWAGSSLESSSWAGASRRAGRPGRAGNAPALLARRTNGAAPGSGPGEPYAAATGWWDEPALEGIVVAAAVAVGPPPRMVTPRLAAGRVVGLELLMSGPRLHRPRRAEGVVGGVEWAGRTIAVSWSSTGSIALSRSSSRRMVPASAARLEACISTS